MISDEEDLKKKLNEATNKDYSENEIVQKNKKEKEAATKRKNAKNLDEIIEIDLNAMGDEETNQVSPKGYIPVKLSTKGFLGAPKLFHIRSFDTPDLVNLAMSEQEDLPLKLIEIFDRLIYEDNITVADFHTNEVIELVIVMIRSFLSRYIKDLPYELQEADWKYQENFYGGKDTEGYKKFINDLNSKIITPKITIDIDSLLYYEVDENTKTIVKVSNKENGFSAKFSYPQYGDVAVLKKFLDTYFKEKDRRYAKLMGILKTKRQKEEEVFRGNTEINYRHIPGITPEEEKELNEYDNEKAQIMVYALKALHLKELNGVDVSEMSLYDKISLVKEEPRYNHETLTQVTEYFDKNLKVGVNTEKVTYVNPITMGRVTATFPFRLDTLFQTLRDSKSDNTIIEFE